MLSAGDRARLSFQADRKARTRPVDNRGMTELTMSNGDLNWITNFIWGIADDALRDLYTRGKYRDVILPMIVLRRLDAVLEPTKQAVLSMKEKSSRRSIANQDAALRQAAGQAFYNASRFTCVTSETAQARRSSGPIFEAYLNGFSPNVQEILENFKSKPGPETVQGRRPRDADREVPRSIDQSWPAPGAKRRWFREASRPRQPCDGDDLRGACPALNEVNNEEAGAILVA